MVVDTRVPQGGCWEWVAGAQAAGRIGRETPGTLTVAANLLAQQIPFNAIFLISDPMQKWRLLGNFLLYMLPFLAPVEQPQPPLVEPLMELGQELQRGWGQDFGGASDVGRFGNDPEDIKHIAQCSTGSMQIE